MRKLKEYDISAIIGNMNHGYEIKCAKIKDGDCTDSEHYGIVLGVNQEGHYVTWQFHLDEHERPSYYWGNYFNTNEERAIADYELR
ncbi:MAG: hypothetical protein LBR56_06870 [Sporomusaceae bacterium]|jgi:hypothetical protein|nr:hypothetical protein [Sporomusaceae bacterium]